MLNRTVAPHFKEIKDVNLVEPEKMVYANGLKTFIFQAPDLDLIKLEFTFDNILLKEELAILNPVLSSMLREGTESLTSKQIADTVDFYGAYLMPEYSFDQSSLTVYTMHKYVDKILPILADILQHSIIPQAELDTHIRNNKQSLQISLQKNDVLARRNFYKEVFKGTRYGVLPTEETYDAIERAHIVELYRKQIQPANCNLFIAGNIDANLKSLIATLFGQEWENTHELVKKTSLEFQPYSSELLIKEKPEALQSAVRLGGLTINRRHIDFPALQFVNTLFGGFFGSRLMRNIREEKGYTYSIGSYIGNLRHTGFITIASEVGVDVTQNTLSEIQKEFEILRNEKTSEEEIALVRNYMQGMLLGSLESIFSHVDKFKAVYFSGLGTEYYQYYSYILKDMNADKVQDIAQRYFDYDKLFKVVVGKI
ncbi:M16 family metallopeptidase [Sphingobacterium sp. SGL-16]|uniref:M16 family metallopeptidase n=1 Tax=Sphingobacterium sp. SGL-16 TaxID=2710883 RepID=UPI0013ED62FD|nr:pitrilysin family protein [Sphingobacterium sp. SGL-16]NGM71939.1 insulinase family protein [Sphingobacterium sp. SGL-16]